MDLLRDKLQHEMYLNGVQKAMGLLNGTDKLQHEMYLNLTWANSSSPKMSINFNMRCI